MNKGHTVLAQLLDGLDGKEFARCEAKYPMARATPAFSAYDHFATMVFAQLTNRDSLRSIELCLSVRKGPLFHSGIRGRVTRCNLAYANEKRSYCLFADIAAILMRRAQKLYANERLPIELDGEFFAIDSSLIDLSLKLFPWAEWQTSQSALKLNLMLDLRGDIPAFADLTKANISDVRFLDHVPIQANSYYVIDRGYVDLARLFRITTSLAWFVTRLKRKMRWYTKKCHEVADEERNLGVRSDHTIVFHSPEAKRKYPQCVRRVRFKDPETGNSLTFFTNNFILSAYTIALIYKNRWRIEIYFKWLKQNLKLRGFYSNHPNGVRIQIWSALCTFLLVAIAKKRHQLPGELHLILENLSIAPLEKVPLSELFTKYYIENTDCINQMSLELNEFC